MQSRLKEIDELINLGQIAQARHQLSDLQGAANNDPALAQHVAAFYSQLGFHQEAYDLYAIALQSKPDDLNVLYNAATAAIAVGKLQQAEDLLNIVINAKGDDYDAYYNRSTLKKQTADNNHIKQMEDLLKAGIPDHKGAVQLFYALAKEYEDLGDYEPGFLHLQRGANLRAAMLSYRVDDDVQTMQALAETFDRSVLEGIPGPSSEPGPIFIVGLPRSGTTLVDRIVSSHSDVASLGEINDLALAVVRLAGKAQNKQDLIEKTATLDMQALEDSYLGSTAGRGIDAAYLVDKTPSNFLYLGLIAKAMPTARIIHLTRDPMDSCFAIYKTLFRMGYPYSYRLEDLGDYYAAYARLMAHWHNVLPGRILDVAYHDLVSDFEPQVRRLLDHCGLDWLEACLSFHKNSSPSATASAAQVRQPLYASSVGRWRRYADHLRPLQARLAQHGINIEDQAS